MAKSNRSAGRAPRYRRRKRQQQASRWLPWAVGGIVVLIAAIVIGRNFLGPQSPGNGPRAEEWLAGVTGLSYDNGPTQYAYPDPAGLGAGHQWLPALGSADAPVTVVEYSDIFCSHCRDFHLNSLEGILKDYVATGKVRYVDHYFGFANTVQQGAVLAEMCAAEQGRYFEYRHALFQLVEVGDYNVDRAARLAGIDQDAFNQCRTDGRYNAAIQEIVFTDNQGVNSTPTFFINGHEIAGDVPERIRQVIDEAVAQAGG